MSRIKHQKVLAALEKRALRYRYRGNWKEARREDSEGDVIDETGTVSTASLTDDESDEDGEPRLSLPEIRQQEMIATLGVQEEVLTVHGVAPGTKADGVVRLIYENLDGLSNTISGNEKLEKEKGIIDDLEADLACFNEHNQILLHKDNKNGYSQLFKGGDVEVRSVSAHNSHEGKEVGRHQEGGTAALVFGQMIEQYDFEASGRDESGLGRWVVLVFHGSGGITMRVVCGYCPCKSSKKATRSSYQQARRFYITKEKDLTCPRVRFQRDLVAQLKKWRAEGDRLVVCLDANADIYQKELGKALTDMEGLNMSEVVGDFSGSLVGPTRLMGCGLLRTFKWSMLALCQQVLESEITGCLWLTLGCNH